MEATNGAGQIGVNDLLLARGVGGGYGGGFGGGYGMDSHGANGAYGTGSNAVRIDAHAQAHEAGLENLLDQNQFAATNKNIVDGFSRVSDSASANVSRVSDQIINQEFRNGDRLRDLEREMTQNARVAADCCCDTKLAIMEAAKDAAQCCCDAKLEASKSHAEIMATVMAQNSLTREQIRGDALGAANAELQSLKTQIACGCCNS